MDVKLIVSRGGKGFVQNAGDVVSVTPEEAKRMIAAQQAVSVEKAVKRARVETASK